MRACNPGSRETETDKSQGLNNQANLVGKLVANERLCLKEKEMFAAQRPCHRWSTHMYNTQTLQVCYHLGMDRLGGPWRGYILLTAVEIVGASAPPTHSQSRE